LPAKQKWKMIDNDLDGGCRPPQAPAANDFLRAFPLFFRLDLNRDLTQPRRGWLICRRTRPLLDLSQMPGLEPARWLIAASSDTRFRGADMTGRVVLTPPDRPIRHHAVR